MSAWAMGGFIDFDRWVLLTFHGSLAMDVEDRDDPEDWLQARCLVGWFGLILGLISLKIS